MPSGSRDLYTPLPTATSIRVIELHPTPGDDAIVECTLHLTDLECDTLDFDALSYTWGDPLYRYWFEEKSTTWVRDVSIICNGMRVDVTTNLENALKAIRTRRRNFHEREHQVQYLWIDKLCINQDDVQERNTQVGLMARIYSKASLVISWLGPADRDSDQAIPLMQRLNKLKCFDDMQGHRQYAQYSMFMKKSLNEDDTKEIDLIPTKQYESLTRFLARQYFFRCWVLQEVMLARRICMLCGTDTVDLADLRRIALLVAWIKKHRLHDNIGQALTLPIKPNRHFDHEKAILELFQNRWRLLHKPMMQRETLPFTFEQLVILARMSGCVNPKDKIFGLLGIVPRGAFGLTADYSKTTEQVYIEATRHLTRETRSLNCLSWVTDRSARKFSDFPTWIGEFEDDAYQTELAFAHVVYKATLESEVDIRSVAPGGNRVLRARGIEIDHIVELAEPWEWQTKRFRFDTRWTTITLKLPRIYHFTGQTRGEALFTTLVSNEVGHLPLNRQHDMDHFKDMVRRLTCTAVIRHLHYLLYYSDREKPAATYEDAALKVLRDIDMLSKGDNTGLLTSWAEIWYTEKQSCICKARLSHVDLGIKTLPRPPPNPACPYITDFHLPKPDSHPYRSSISDRIARFGVAAGNFETKLDWRDYHYSRAIEKHAQFRRLARTDKGYLGLVPTSSEVGDAVCLLQGARVPFVLRRSGKSAGHGTKRSAWEVMGDAYVHGIMQGEVWGDVKDQLIDIDLV